MIFYIFHHIRHCLVAVHSHVHSPTFLFPPKEFTIPVGGLHVQDEYGWENISSPQMLFLNCFLIQNEEEVLKNLITSVVTAPPPHFSPYIYSINHLVAVRGGGGGRGGCITQGNISLLMKIYMGGQTSPLQARKANSFIIYLC